MVEVPPSNDKPLNPSVDAIEASPIQVGKRWQVAADAVLIVMDDRAGRLQAKNRGFTLIGLPQTGSFRTGASISGVTPWGGTILDRLMHRCSLLAFEGKSGKLTVAAAR